MSVPGNRWDQLDGRRPREPPRVSVVVVHFEQPAALARTLRALSRQDHPAGRLEVLVVDDGSAEPPVVPTGVRLLRQERSGFRAAAARNLGAREAQGEVLCFLDADTVPEPGYVGELTRLPALLPEAVTVGRRRHADLARLPQDADVEASAVPLPEPEWLTRGYAATANLLDADARSYRYVISAVLACRAELFAELGGFDASFEAYGGEDWDWGYRAWLAGAVLAHVPSAVAWHDGPDFAGRAGPGALMTKNAETLRLADRIPVPGSRGRGVVGATADVLVRLPAPCSPAAAFACVDSLLAALPAAAVLVPDALARGFATDPRVLPGARAEDPRLARHRVRIDLEGPVRVRGGGLRDAVERVAAEGLGPLHALAADGALLARLRSRRATARHERWGAPRPEERRGAVLGLESLPPEPDLEALLGGWA